MDATRALWRPDEARDQAIPALVSARDDPASRVVAVAVTSLGLHRDLPATARREIEKLREHSDDEVRRRDEAVLRRRQPSPRSRFNISDTMPRKAA